MNIPDPTRIGSEGDFFCFPFNTIESVHVVNDHTIIVANDNNYPFSNGRARSRTNDRTGPLTPDENEFILINLSASFTRTRACSARTEWSRRRTCIPLSGRSAAVAVPRSMACSLARSEGSGRALRRAPAPAEWIGRERLRRSTRRLGRSSRRRGAAGAHLVR
jgi:hypothetical protein